jgi:hypothetical protein
LEVVCDSGRGIGCGPGGIVGPDTQVRITTVATVIRATKRIMESPFTIERGIRPHKIDERPSLVD